MFNYVHGFVRRYVHKSAVVLWGQRGYQGLELAQRLSTCFYSTHLGYLQMPVNSSPRRPNAIFSSLEVPSMPMVHIHMYRQNTHTHKMIKYILKNKRKRKRKKKGGHWIPWSWGYRWLWTTQYEAGHWTHPLEELLTAKPSFQPLI